jgi:hypothetical protein
MKLTAISLNRKFNLGNYETLDVGLEAQLSEKDNPLDAWKQLEDLAEMHLQTRTAKPEAKPTIAPKPSEKADNQIPQLKYDKSQQAPTFDSEELMKHKWKGKRTGEGSYAEGSLSWGWDFRDKFSKEVIAVLQKGLLVIDQYEFTLSENLVSVKKKKA